MSEQQIIINIIVGLAFIFGVMFGTQNNVRVDRKGKPSKKHRAKYRTYDYVAEDYICYDKNGKYMGTERRKK